ncbi:hypothetical protein [Bacillus toyonensis]|uniref:hypothetical protein n=1 Tax=Bacillus toyonensis TaxID=155322 RepID=UPI0037FFFEB1
MNIYLSALGWVADSPQGNRLRWHYPLQTVDASDQYFGFPETIIVERAPVDDRECFRIEEASASYPYSWWDQQGDIIFNNLVPMNIYNLPSPVQALCFRWSGSQTRISFRDTVLNKTIADRMVNGGEKVYIEASMIDSIIVYSGQGMLEGLKTLDLFHDRSLDWKPLAEINVGQTFTQDFNVIKRRYNQSSTLTKNEWQELVTLVQTAQSSSPASKVEGELTAWDYVELILGMRWEFALLGGFGFFDGPHTDICNLDKVLGELLTSPSNMAMAYRVRDVDNRANVSNIVLCQPSLATPLSNPSPPKYESPEVRLVEQKISRYVTNSSAVGSNGSMSNFNPLVRIDGDFNVRLNMHLQQSDSRAIGVEIEEIIDRSPTTGAAKRQHSFISRSRRPEDLPMQVDLERVLDVDFPDVTLQSRARAYDAWDRMSNFSAWTNPTGLQLYHEPPAPPLEFASYEAATGTVRITRPLKGDWNPDKLVRLSGGHVFFYRQSKEPRTDQVMFSDPMPINGDLYRVKVSGTANLNDFIGGTLSIDGFTETIISVDGSDVHFRVPVNEGSVISLFGKGAGRLVQDIKHSSLWSKVADFPVDNLPTEFVFNDPLPSTEHVVVYSYLARLSYFGRLGPGSNIVRALRHPENLPVPPPFEVEILGIDFFRRTMLKIKFTKPGNSGLYTVWWADGQVLPKDLPRYGAAGLYGAQKAQDGEILYDVIALPIPQHVNRTITIGVHSVNEGGLQSNFYTAQVVISAQ